MTEWVWVLEAFDRASRELRGRYRLAGMSDGEVRTVLGVADLGTGDLYDVPDASLVELGDRFGVVVRPESFAYLLGREVGGSVGGDEAAYDGA